MGSFVGNNCASIVTSVYLADCGCLFVAESMMLRVTMTSHPEIEQALTSGTPTIGPTGNGCNFLPFKNRL